jgi:hypothetical protein
MASTTDSANRQRSELVRCLKCISLLRLTYAIVDPKTGKVERIYVCRDCGDIKWE